MIDGVFLDGLSLTILSIPQGTDGDKSCEKDFIYSVATDMGGILEFREYGSKGYPKSAVIKGKQENGADWTVFCAFGSHNIGQHLNIECKGGITEQFASIISQYGVNFRVTRADIAMDMIADFQVAHNICKVYARSKSISTSLVGDWEQGINGRTYYIGKSRKESESYIRLYEKGIEMAQKGFKDVPPDLVRLELEYKPKKHKRQHITSLVARDILSTALNPLELFENFLDEGIEPVKISARKEKSYKTTVRHMITQYLSAMNEFKENEGMIGLIEEIEYAMKYGHTMGGGEALT